MEIFKSKYRENSDNYCANLGKGKYLGVKVENYLEQKNVEKDNFHAAYLRFML